jgi:prolipoprotein diacylglyceryltransferase
MWFGTFIMPLTLWPLMLLPMVLLRKNRMLYLDFFALTGLLFMGFYKFFNCAQAGCCYGIPLSWGVYNNQLGTIVMPVQYFEAAFNFLGAVVCVLYLLFSRFYRPGRAVSFSLIWFAVVRFAADYFRYSAEGYRPDEKDGLFGLSMAQVTCVAAVLVCIAWLPLIRPVDKLLNKIANWVDNRLFAAWNAIRGSLRKKA